ncbi:serpin family protein [Pleomorphovibrio marinus]|uniref:serpin family protein n=1 Tax=Pleomorphovibrio marinus TaxID=2164132 RepID=UPI001E6030D0|nr:serpin family protein [Pleomorphovibrio marinus]
MKITILNTTLGLLTLSLLVSSCDWFGGGTESPVTANIRALEASERELVHSSSQFALDLFQQLRKNGDPNQFYSPYSIHQALALAMNGNEDEVLEEFKNLLHYEGMELENANRAAESLTRYLLELDPKVRLAIANAIWYRQEFQVYTPFKDTVSKYYSAEIAPLDMTNPQSVNVINGWIETNTNGLIKDMLDAIPSNAVMYLVNALYFKGEWKYRFTSTNTAPFYPSPNREVQVEMLQYDEPANLRGYAEGGLHYLEIPYSTGHYNMGIIMSQEHDLDDKMESFNLEKLEFWRENALEQNLILHFPKFIMGYKIENLKEDLQEMGLNLVFEPSTRNFTKLFDHPTEPLAISRVIHDAFIEVDEKGTEAAAATVVEIFTTSAGPQQPRMLRVDKPFVFFIQDNHSGAILFIGQLGDPSQL